MSKTQIVINTVIVVVLLFLMHEFYTFLKANIEFMTLVDQEITKIHQKLYMEKMKWN